MRIRKGCASAGGGASSCFASFAFPPLDRFFRGFAVSAETVEPFGKDMHDRQEVFGEFDFGRLFVVVENHELDSVALEEPSEELESESAESVTVGHGNRSYVSVKRSSQKGFKTFALEVEPAADVFDNFGAGAAFLEEGDLSFKVCFLAGGGDAAVGDVDARRLVGELLRLLLQLLLGL